MKYTEKEYVVTKDYAESLIHKRHILRKRDDSKYVQSGKMYR